MTPEYKRGTVATATVRGVPGVRVLRLDERNPHAWVSSGCAHLRDDEMTDIRPLVVLDLNANGYSAEGFASLIRTASKYATRDVDAQCLAFLANLIEEASPPPKPAEPTGLGAVVEDARGARWILTMSADVDDAKPWVRDHLPGNGLKYAVYTDIAAVRILSSGVEA